MIYTNLTTDQICTILAALRMAERDAAAFHGICDELGILPLRLDEIDELCEALNLSKSVPPSKVKENQEWIETEIHGAVVEDRSDDPRSWVIDADMIERKRTCPTCRGFGANIAGSDGCEVCQREGYVYDVGNGQFLAEDGKVRWA